MFGSPWLVEASPRSLPSSSRGTLPVQISPFTSHTGLWFTLLQYYESYLIRIYPTLVWSSLIVQLVKNLPAMQETPVWFLGRKDPLGKAKANHASILAWRIPGTGEPGGLPSMRSHRVGHDWSDSSSSSSSVSYSAMLPLCDPPGSSVHGILQAIILECIAIPFSRILL